MPQIFGDKEGSRWSLFYWGGGGGLPGPLPLLNYFINNTFLKEAVLCNLWSAVIYWLGCKNSYVSFLFIMNLLIISS